MENVDKNDNLGLSEFIETGNRNMKHIFLQAFEVLLNVYIQTADAFDIS